MNLNNISPPYSMKYKSICAHNYNNLADGSHNSTYNYNWLDMSYNFKLSDMSYNSKLPFQDQFILNISEKVNSYLIGLSCSTSATWNYCCDDQGTGPFWNSDTTHRFIPPPDQKLREMIRARQAPLIIGTRKAVSLAIDKREQRARDTLRRLVGEAQYRRFLAHGFITAHGKSGKIYQIRPGHGMTTVYSSDGKRIEKLCVVLRGNFPPTDELITRFLMILNSEDHFRSLANIYPKQSNPRIPAKQQDLRPLPEIFKMLKRQAA